MTGGASPRRRGDYFERQTLGDLTRHGWLVVRCPGSGSGAEGTPLEGTGTDLLAIKRGCVPLLISCKIGGRAPQHEKGALVETAHRYGAMPLIAWRPWAGRIAYRRVRGGDEWRHNDAHAAES